MSYYYHRSSWDGDTWNAVIDKISTMPKTIPLQQSRSLPKSFSAGCYIYYFITVDPDDRQKNLRKLFHATDEEIDKMIIMYKLSGSNRGG
jgi:hypothetical protein